MPQMPFDVARALLRFAWHRSWSVALSTLPPGELQTALAARQRRHGELAKEALETWNVVAMPWASGPRGCQRGRLVVENVRTLVQSAAEHCALMRIYEEKDGKNTIELQKPAREPYQKFEAARSELENLHGTLAHALFERIVDFLWAVAWHAANTVADQMDSNEEGEEEEGEDDGENGDEDEDEADEQDPFGDDYPGSSDDAVDDMRQLLKAFHGMFHADEPFRGVRCSLASEMEGSPSVLESISRVPGAFGAGGLNAIRLLLPDWSGCAEKFDSTAGEFLLKAEALNLQVVLELPAVPGKVYEDWLRSLARSVSPMKCVRGVAMPRIQDLSRATGLMAALRQGGLTQDRCACFLQLPEGKVDECQEMLYRSDVSTDAEALPLWLADGHVMMEAPAHIECPEKPDTAQMVLDAASLLSQEHEHLDLVCSWSLALPGSFQKAEIRTIQEFAQRMLASMEAAERGWFFESWSGSNGSPERSLQACLERDWINLSATEQVMYPPDNHTRSLVYLHGFTCSGYDYLKEPHYVYRPKPKKKKAKGKASKDEEEEEELEPFPGLKVVFPTAPKRPITCYKGEVLHAWHDYITDHEGDQEDELSMEDLQETTARIHTLLDAEAALVGGKNVFLGGASQGCGTALHAALTYEGELGGVIGTMGHLLSCTPIKENWIAKKIPIFVYNGLEDSTMKWHEWVKATYCRLQDAKADIHIVLDEGVDHGENEDVWMRNFLTQNIKGSAAKSKSKG